MVVALNTTIKFYVTMKAIVRHHLYMKTGSGCDQTLPDCMMTFIFGWGKTDIQNLFRRSEIESMTDEEKKTMQDKTSLIISDYQATSAAFQAHHQRDVPEWPM